MADQELCPECKCETEIVFDYAAGDTVCSECGLVLDARYIDERAEWRNFANESADDKPDRVGGPSNPLLADCGLSTVITGPSRARSDQSESQIVRKQRRASSDGSLIQAFSEIAQVVDRLGLLTTVKDRANEVYKKAHDQKLTRNPKNKNALLGACIYIACRQENVSRTPKEICSGIHGVNKAEITRAITTLKKRLIIEVEATGSSPIERFCSILGIINRNTVNSVKQLVEKCGKLDLSNSPSSIAAAAIFLVTQQSDNKKPIKDICCATGVSEHTIKKVVNRIKEKI